MNRALKFSALLLCLCIVPAAYAQGKCSLQKLAGTYVTYERGSSLTIDPSLVGVLSPAQTQGTPPAWAALGFMPFVNVAEITFTPEGSGDGYFWMWAGSVSATLDPIPVHITVTEMNEDCTGKFQYALPNGAVVEERIIVFDNGRQFRSIPTTLASPGVPTLAWIGTGHRISRGSAPVNFCGPQTTHGTYLLSCENIIRSGLFPTKAVADTFLLRMDVSMTGDYTGTLYEKFGASKIELPVFGTMVVNPDCSFTDTINIPSLPSTVIEKGVFFDEGKQFYGLGILNPSLATDKQNIKYSFCQGTRIGE